MTLEQVRIFANEMPEIVRLETGGEKHHTGKSMIPAIMSDPAIKKADESYGDVRRSKGKHKGEPKTAPNGAKKGSATCNQKHEKSGRRGNRRYR